MEGKITPAQIDHYRRLIDIHEQIKDPLVMVRAEDLKHLVNAYERPRIRRAAPSVPT